MTKKHLYQMIQNYRVLCAEIERKEAQIQKEKLHVVDAVQTAAEHPYWLHTIPVEGDVYPPEVEGLRRVVARKNAEKAYIVRFVNGIEDYKVRRAIEIKYLDPSDGMVTWEMVADQLNDGSTGDSIRKKITRFFE